MAVNSNDETNRHVVNLCKSFANNLSANVKLLHTQIIKIIQSIRFLGRLLGPLIKVGLWLMKNALKP